MPTREPAIVDPPEAITLRARLKLSDRDIHVLEQLGQHVGKWISTAVARRSAAGNDFGADAYKVLYHELRALGAPAAYAAPIGKQVNADWRTARSVQRTYMPRLRAGIRAIEARAAVPTGTDGGYRTPKMRHTKLQRADRLRARLAKVEADYDAGRVRVCRGGKKLARARHGADTPDKLGAWQTRWTAARTSIRILGDTNRTGGSRWLRWDPDDGSVAVLLPYELSHLGNHRVWKARSEWYRLDATVDFAGYRNGQAWRRELLVDAVTGTGTAVLFGIKHDPAARTGRGGWYLTATFVRPTVPAPQRLPERQPVVAVDLNDGHLAVQALDRHGNPTRRRANLPIPKVADRPTRGQNGAALAAAAVAIRDLARATGARHVVVEDLAWGSDHAATIREKFYATHHRDRRAHLPTARMVAALVASCSLDGIAVVAVNPAWSSVNGRRYWTGTAPQHTFASGTYGDVHLAAATVLGRRAQTYADRRTSRRTPDPHQRMRADTGDRQPEDEGRVNGRMFTRPDPTDAWFGVPGADPRHIATRGRQQPAADPPATRRDLPGSRLSTCPAEPPAA